MSLRNNIIIGAVAVTIAVGSYLGINARKVHLAEIFVKMNEPIVGTVLEERYQNILLPVPESHKGVIIGKSHSNETVKLESQYTLRLRTDDGKVLGVSVIDSEPCGAVTKESLEILIEEGTRISFPRGNMRIPYFFVDASRNYDREETPFQDDTQVGTKKADRITILDTL